MREELRQYSADRKGERAASSDGRYADEAKSCPNPADDSFPNAILAIGSLPDHLGWGSQHLSQVLRRSLQNKPIHNYQSAQQAIHRAEWLQAFRPPPPGIKTAACPQKPDRAGGPSPDFHSNTAPSAKELELQTVKLHPDIGLGVLRRKLAAAGRIWLLLRWIDSKGRGWVKLDQMRIRLCDRESAIHVCGWRQMRSLIGKGEGIFWEQHAGRLWLRSIPKVALALGIERLSGRPVAVPVKILLQGIGQVRAHFFTSFHSGRNAANPISRRSLHKISEVSPRSQQDYERRAGVRKLKNFAVGPRLAHETAKDWVWRRGSACFNWCDQKGALGTQGQSRLAWQLPNSYTGPHKQQARGRQKQFNRELAVLFAKGITGNDHVAVELQSKRYFAGAKKAARSQNHPQDGAYWRGSRPGLWYFMDLSRES